MQSKAAHEVLARSEEVYASSPSYATIMRTAVLVACGVSLVAVFLAYLIPRSFPGIAARLGKIGAFKGTQCVVLIHAESVAFPPGKFIIQLNAAEEKAMSRVSDKSKFPEALGLALPRWANDIEVSVLEPGNRRAAKGTIPVAALLRGTRVPVQLHCTDPKRLVSPELMRFQLHLHARTVSDEKTPLFKALGSERAPAGGGNTGSGSDADAIANALHGPLRCLGTGAAWAGIATHNGPRLQRRVLCMYEDDESQEPLFTIPIASIASVTTISPGSFQLRVHNENGGVKTMDFFGDTKESAVWAKGLRALSQSSLQEEGTAKLRAERLTPRTEGQV